MKIRFCFLFCLLVGFAFSACNSPSVTPRVVFVGETHDDKTVRVVNSGRVEVDLYGDPDTGYLWKLTSTVPSELQQIGQARVRRYTDSLGSSGTTTYSFRARELGEAELDFVFRHPETDDIKDSFSVNIKVVESDTEE